MMDRRGTRRATPSQRPGGLFQSTKALVGAALAFASLTACAFYLGASGSASAAVLGLFGGSNVAASVAVGGSKLKIFSGYSEHPAARKQRQDISFLSSKVEHIVLTIQQQGEFIRANECGTAESTVVYQRFRDLVSTGRSHLSVELWKYCALYMHGGMYLDAESPLVDTLEHIMSKKENVAVLNDSAFSQAIHGSLLFLRHPESKVARGMVDVLTMTSLEDLDSSPLVVPVALYNLIATEASAATLYPGSLGEGWFLLQHKCSIDPLRRPYVSGVSSHSTNTFRPSLNCPEPSGFCCSVSDIVDHTATLMTKHILLPYPVIPHPSDLPKPFNPNGDYNEEDLPFISTIRGKVNPPPEEPLLTPNFFETLLQNDCLPSDKKCSDCLRDKKGSNCQKCLSVCPCYCRALCHVPVEEKFISQELIITPPPYARDPSRLIPRIVHQTWFEDVTPDKYPNMSRLIESFKQSGWEYKFYTDDDAISFLKTHFPIEVSQAYVALRPGAFKADLFRYCVLLIVGGVYADMDIMLESSLDLAVGPDVGFMTPQDEPGTDIDDRMCLWNGLIAAAPGHPFLAKTIETVVNNVRNRFTSVDTDNMFCPDPELSMLHAFDTLFTAGPCILGAMLNKVLGRNLQTPFQAGEIDPWEAGRKEAAEKSTQFVTGVDDKPSTRIPGRTIILHQNKWDMGSHRFTLLEKNLVVAATDLPDADDRANQANPKEHYSKTHVKAGIYGLEHLYIDNKRANEEIRFYVDAQRMRSVESIM